MPSDPKRLIRNFWGYPQLRKDIPSVIDSARKKYFALSDAAEAQWKRYTEMEQEYFRLQKELDEAVFKPANPEQEDGRFNR